MLVQAQFGVLKETELTFQGKLGNYVDYHQDTNGDLFKEWFVYMLRSLEEGCLVVMECQLPFHESRENPV